jgi:hypothetical protein
MVGSALAAPIMDFGDLFTSTLDVKSSFSSILAAFFAFFSLLSLPPFGLSVFFTLSADAIFFTLSSPGFSSVARSLAIAMLWQ